MVYALDSVLMPTGALGVFSSVLIYTNVTWSFINLVPFWPLDGGQLFRLLIKQRLNANATGYWLHTVGLVMAVLGMYWGGSRGSIFIILLAAYLGYMNFGELDRFASWPAGLRRSFKRLTDRSASNEPQQRSNRPGPHFHVLKGGRDDDPEDDEWIH